MLCLWPTSLDVCGKKQNPALTRTGFDIFKRHPAATQSRGDRERFSFDALADGTATDALGADSAGGRPPGGLFDMHRLQVDEVMAFGDASRLATVSTQVLGLAAFDFRVASTCGSATDFAHFHDNDYLLIGRDFRRAGSIEVSTFFASLGSG